MPLPLDKAQIYALGDLELARALHLYSISEIAGHLITTAWERDFVQNVVEYAIVTGSMTWKQRRVARRIVFRFVEVQARRAYVTAGSPSPKESP